MTRDELGQMVPAEFIWLLFVALAVVGSNWERVLAEHGVFDFCDFSQSRIRASTLIEASRVGAMLEGAQAVDVNIEGGDFFVAEMSAFERRGRRTADSRFLARPTLNF